MNGVFFLPIFGGFSGNTRMLYYTLRNILVAILFLVAQAIRNTKITVLKP